MLKFVPQLKADMAYQNSIFLDVIGGKVMERPPVWIMRQAGRTLPHYRAVRQSVSGFMELVKRPDLIAEVTVEPLDVHGVDACILFSDILVIPEAMGLPYTIIEQRGPQFAKVITSRKDVEVLLSGDDVLPNLDYVFQSITTTKAAIANRVPLIGFAGAPWTIFAYMIEGKGSKTFSQAKRFLYEEPALSHQLLQKITDSTIAYLRQKIGLGVNAIQLFDSWAEMLTIDHYLEFSIPYVRQIFEATAQVPRIFFPKGAWSVTPYLIDVPFEVLGIDWKTPVGFVRETFPHRIIQGNLDPCLLYASKEQIAKKAKETMHAFGGRHIMNLGHGVYPDTEASKISHLVSTVKSFRYA